MFAYTEETTKSEQETDYQAELDSEAATTARNTRNTKISESDWMALSDVIMSDEWKTYRQALRDVPAQSGFPNDITWPTEP